MVRSDEVTDVTRSRRLLEVHVGLYYRRDTHPASGWAVLPGAEEGQDVLQALRHRVHTASLPPHPFTFFANSFIVGPEPHARGEVLLRRRRTDAQAAVFRPERVNAVLL